MDDVLLAELDWAARRHLLFALDAHLVRCDGGRMPVPPVLVVLRDVLAARNGPKRTSVAPPALVVDPDVMLHRFDAAGARLGLSERTVRRLVARGDLAAISIGRSKRIHRDELEKYADRLREDA